MMMPMMGQPRRAAGGMELLMRFMTDPALKAAVTRLPRQLATLAAPDVKSAVAWRTFELNPMMGMGMMSMGMMRGPGRADAPAHMMGINGRSFAMGRIDVTARLGTAEIWEISAGGMPIKNR
jgi:FtsP/CotA-like multicopper oxidase with cupredoxin domain